MPIYEYRCGSCGVQNDVMQKMSDAELTTCPACGKETYSKQLSAAGFQLKGNGYYVTDFKNKPAPACGTGGCGSGGCGGNA
ncbi:MAG TPA: zinc ribbon domain-containing protein [Gallionellaceae bacterium]